MAKKKQQQKGSNQGKGRILAGWQRALLWVVWLGVLALIINNTDSDSLGGPEFLAIIAGIAITVWTHKNPKGLPNIVIAKSGEVRGVFESRTNWALVIVAAGVALGGLAMTVKLHHDLNNGISTWKDVFDDIVHYFIQELIQRLSGGTDGDVTRTKLYIMAIMLPIGLLWLWFVLMPFLHRGRRFRVEEDGTLLIEKDGDWQPLALRDYATIEADGSNIQMFTTGDTKPAVELPIGRVYSRDLGTRVETPVLVKFFRESLEQSGFQVERLSAKGMVETSWSARRAD